MGQHRIGQFLKENQVKFQLMLLSEHFITAYIKNVVTRGSHGRRFEPTYYPLCFYLSKKLEIKKLCPCKSPDIPGTGLYLVKEAEILIELLRALSIPSSRQHYENIKVVLFT